VALGQFEIYKSFLEVTTPERQLYIAISSRVYEGLFNQKAYQFSCIRHKTSLKLQNTTLNRHIKKSSQ